MREKLREIRNKEEGFTLVELLAVIAILAIIVAIAVPAIGNVISDSKSKAEKAEIELIEDAARLAITATGAVRPTTSNDKVIGGHVTVEDLVNEGYLVLEDGEREGLSDKSNGAVGIDGEGKYTYLDEVPTNTDKIDITD